MHTPNTQTTPSNPATPVPAQRKLQRLAHLLRVASAAYAAWVLWEILHWWLDGERVVRDYGHFIARDLSTMHASQRWAALGLDLVSWALLLLAVGHCWRFLQTIGQPTQWNNTAARHINLCAWFALGSQGLAILSRPLKSYLLTAHLPPLEHVWKWHVYTIDLQTTLLCLALLMFAYVFTWTLEIAEENRNFV